MRRIATIALAVLLGSAACSEDPTTGATASTTSTVASRPSAPPGDAPAGLGVGSRTIELVDPTRPTDADPGRDLAEQPDRTLSVLLLYPAEGAVTAGAPVDGAAAADGAFPLVVFSHGVTATGPAYQGRLQEWARAGYVVAAPTYPLSSGPGGLIGDYVNQPADVSFVIDELLALPDDDPLAGHIDPDAVAAAGHSLGAITTLGVSLHSCCADERLRAAVELSGIRLPFAGGDFDLDRVPFLAVHGAEDTVVPVSGSDSLFEEAPGPAAYLRLPEGDHSGFLIGDGPLVDQVVIAFLDTHLKDDPSALDPIPDLVAASGRATFEVK